MNCCKMRPLSSLLSWLKCLDGSCEVPSSSPRLSLTSTEAPSNGNRLPQHNIKMEVEINRKSPMGPSLGLFP
uniref:Secreted protein n=1 Tax=Romanomermis culicivorax TaxID=13658 RepID=A0A915IG41_ROMCU